MKNFLVLLTALAVICSLALVANAGTVVSSILEVQSKTLQFLDGVAAYFGTDNDANVKFVAANSQVEFAGSYAFMTAASSVLFAGGLDINDDKAIHWGDGNDWGAAFDEAGSDNLEFTAASATSSLAVLIGNWIVGAGTPTVALNGGDGYVTDHLEVDGAFYADGGATVKTSLNLDYCSAGQIAYTDGSKNLVCGTPTLRTGANTACATTCTNHGPVLTAFNTDTAFAIVAPSDAAADGCMCAN